MKTLTAVLNFVDERAIVRRIAFFWVLWITGTVIRWSMDFAQTSTRPGMEVAAILAAVWTPMTALQAAVFAFYDRGRSKAEA